MEFWRGQLGKSLAKGAQRRCKTIGSKPRLVPPFAEVISTNPLPTRGHWNFFQSEGGRFAVKMLGGGQGSLIRNAAWCAVFGGRRSV